MPANPSHAGVKRLWRRPLLASHFDYKTHESTAWRRRRPELSQTSNPKRKRLRRQRATLAAPATRPKVPTSRRKFARTRAPAASPRQFGCRRPLGRREISLFVKFEPRRGGDAGAWGPEAVPLPRAPLPTPPLHPRQDTVCRGGGWGTRSEPTCRPARDPPPQTSDWHLFKSPRVPHLLLCLLLGAPPGWRCRRPRPSAPRPRKFDKDRGRGRDGDGGGGGGRGQFLDTRSWGEPVAARKEDAAAGRGGRPAGRRLRPGAPAGRGGGRAAGAARGGGPALRPPPLPAPAPAASPRPGLPLPTSRPSPFVPVCCGDSSPGRAIPPAPLCPPGARRARGPARPAARAGGSTPGPLGGWRGAAAGRRGARAAGAAAAVGPWPAAAGLEGVYLPAVEPVLADIALDHEAVHVVRLPAHTVHRRGRRGRRSPARSRHRHGCRGGSSCCSRGHRRRRSGHL